MRKNLTRLTKTTHLDDAGEIEREEEEERVMMAGLGVVFLNPPASQEAGGCVAMPGAGCHGDVEGRQHCKEQTSCGDFRVFLFLFLLSRFFFFF